MEREMPKNLFKNRKMFNYYGGRIKSAIREKLEQKGLYVYSIRDCGGVDRLEKYVWVNHLDDIVTNFKIEDHFKDKEDYWDGRLEMWDWYDKLFQFCELDDDHKFSMFVDKMIKCIEQD